MSDEIHAAAILTQLGTVPQTVHDGVVPAGATRPYVLAYITVETSDQSSLGSASDITVTRLFAHCVADDAQGAREVQADVRAVMLDARLAIAGRAVGPVREEESLPPDRDETTGTPVMDAISVYAVTSWPG